MRSKQGEGKTKVRGLCASLTEDKNDDTRRRGACRQLNMGRAAPSPEAARLSYHDSHWFSPTYSLVTLIVTYLLKKTQFLLLLSANNIKCSGLLCKLKKNLLELIKFSVKQLLLL